VAAPLRILLVLTHPVQYASPLFRRYAHDPGLDVTVAYFSLAGAERAFDPDFGVAVEWDVPLLDGYRWIHPPARGGKVLRTAVGWWNPGVWRLVRRGRFDVVVCYGYRAASFWIAALAARISGAKLVWATDATRLEPRADGALVRAKAPVKRVMVPALLSTGDAVLAPSSRTVAFLNGLGLSRSRVFMTPFVVDNAFFERRAREADPAAVREGWDVPLDAFVSLFSGKLVPWKRPQDLLGAIARLDGGYAVFAGDGPLRDDLAIRAERLGVADRVRFLGFVNQSALPGTYAAADILVLPSEFEPFGLVVNEAFASGTPAIVSSACGVVDDLIRDNETGFAYPCGDVTTLSALIEGLAESRERRDALARGARSRVDAWDVEANAFAFSRAMHRITGAT